MRTNTTGALKRRRIVKAKVNWSCGARKSHPFIHSSKGSLADVINKHGHNSLLKHKLTGSLRLLQGKLEL